MGNGELVGLPPLIVEVRGAIQNGGQPGNGSGFAIKPDEEDPEEPNNTASLSLEHDLLGASLQAEELITLASISLRIVDHLDDTLESISVESPSK